MDLNKLISSANDGETSSFGQTQKDIPQPVKTNSQPRLSSIHSLMNENTADAEVQSSVQLPVAAKSEGINSPDTSKIPQPSESTSESQSVPSFEQRAAPFLPSDASGVKVDTIERQSSTTLETPMQPLNPSELEAGVAQKNEKPIMVPQTAVKAKPPLPISTEPKADDAHESNHVAEPEIDKTTEEVNGNLSKPTETSKLHEQIKKLESLKQKEEVDVIPSDGKPKRYRTKPIWAQDYVPVINRPSTDGSDGIRSVKSDLSLNGISKLDIPSLTGYIPRNDFNKLVTEWIWANIEGIKQDYVDVPNVEEHVEVELKFGNIWDKVKDCRIQLPVNTECIVATDYVNQECFFKSGITLENYNNTKNYMTKIIQEAAEQQKQGRGHASNKFVVENSHVLDLIASDARRNDKPISGRVSLDVKTKRKTNSISKQRISDLFLHFPNTLFDLRLSMSLELPNELNDAAFEVFKKRVSTEREKERTSYIHQATATRIDLTKIKEKNNRVPKYELELEINTPSLLRSMRNVADDPLYYIDLVQAFLDNGRIITRQLSNQQKV